MPRQEIPNLFTKISGNLEKAWKKDFGFINTLRGSIYVPPKFVYQHKDADYIEGWAIRKYDKDRDKLHQRDHAYTKRWAYVAELDGDNQDIAPTPIKSKEDKPVDATSSSLPLSEAESNDIKVISMKPPIIVSELADAMSLKPFQLMADLIKLEVFIAPHQAVEPDIAKKLCQMHGYEFKRISRKEKIALNRSVSP